MFPAIGARVMVRFEDVEVACTVENVKTTYGRTRLLVKPLRGKGSQWIETPRVTEMLVKPHESYKCAACGRLEETCSRNPCDAVIKDRES
jgi:hypothetical protein